MPPRCARVAGLEDAAERITAVRTLAAEETRIGMLIGVAIGLELARRAARRRPTTPDKEKHHEHRGRPLPRPRRRSRSSTTGRPS